MTAANDNRLAARPDPGDWDDDDPMTLVEAVKVFGRRYPIRVSTMRSEIHRGRLTASFVGGAFWVTPASLKALFQCPVKPKAPVSISGAAGRTPEPARRSPTAGSSVTERTSAAQAAALSAWGMPREPLLNTSGRSGQSRPAKATRAAS